MHSAYPERRKHFLELALSYQRAADELEKTRRWSRRGE
jgi:hypothetical protein